MRSISVRLDVETDALLRTLCVRFSTSQTDVVRMALEALAKDTRPTPADLAEVLGLVGMFEGGVASSGKAHSAAAHSAEAHSRAVKDRLAARRTRDERRSDATRKPRTTPGA